MEECQEERLYDRMVTHEASPRDWAQLEGIARRDPDAWRRLGLALRDQGDLVQVMDQAQHASQRIELTAPRTPWASRAGWLAAAALLLIWAGSALLGQPSDEAPPVAPLEIGAQQRQADSQLVGELPSVLVGTRELPDGEGVEVTYLRRLIERRTARGLYERNSDEWGQVKALPVSFSPALPQEL